MDLHAHSSGNITNTPRFANPVAASPAKSSVAFGAADGSSVNLSRRVSFSAEDTLLDGVHESIPGAGQEAESDRSSELGAPASFAQTGMSPFFG